MKFCLVAVILGLSLGTVTMVTVCEMKSPRKCLGMINDRFDFGIADTGAMLITSYDNQNYSSCADKCDMHDTCHMATINTDSGHCGLFANISFQSTDFPASKLYLWRCCDPNSSYQAPHRCPGFWRLIVNYQSDNTQRTKDPLQEWRAMDGEKCLHECLKNSICGAANVLTGSTRDEDPVTCQLIIQYPVEQIQLLGNSKWHTYQWQCSGNYSLPVPTNRCSMRADYGFGYWFIQNTSAVFNYSSLQLLFFYTLDYDQCLQNCGHYKDCKAAWYSLVGLYCILEAYQWSTCAQSTPSINYNFTVYVWRNCDQLRVHEDQGDLVMNTCRILANNHYAYIYPIECGHLMESQTGPTHCLTQDNEARGTVFSYNLHCQSNQSFSILQMVQRPFPLKNNSSEVAWFKVTTGYDIFWLINVTSRDFPVTSNKNCRLFNASMDVSSYQNLQIIHRRQWFPSKPHTEPRPFPNHPVKYVIITDTERPFCNCFSVEACSAVLREKEIAQRPMFRSIPHNFVVTGDGLAYEARGWDYAPTLTPSYPFPDSFKVALCGRYLHTPNEKSLISIKQLIDMAISLNKVSRHYTMYIYNDIINEPYPYNGMRHVFQLWPHYRGYTRRDTCSPIRDLVLYLNIMVIITVILIMITVTNIFVKKIIHSKYCLVMRNYRTERIYASSSNQSLPRVSIDRLNNLIYMSPLTTTFYWIDDQPMLLGGTFKCNCLTEVSIYYDMCRIQSKLVNVGHLVLLPALVRCCKKVVIFLNTCDNSDNCLFIHHYDDERVAHRFIDCLHNGRCLCQRFRLNKYNANNQYYGASIAVLEEIRSGSIPSNHSRSMLQDKFSVLVENNYVTRYYS